MQSKCKFGSTAASRLFDKLRKVRELCAELGAEALSSMIGTDAIAQVPDPEARLRLACALVEGHAGPDGGNAAKALRALRLLRNWVLVHNLPPGTGEVSGLPAGRAMVASITESERARASLAGSGSRGGETVAGTIREGLIFLELTCRLPVEASDPLITVISATHVSNPGSAPKPRAHAASLRHLSPLG